MEEMVMKTANLMKKIEFMKSQYQKALSWINLELQNPNLNNDFTLEETIQKLNEAKRKAEEGLAFVREEELKFEQKMEELKMTPILEISKILKEF